MAILTQLNTAFSPGGIECMFGLLIHSRIK